MASPDLQRLVERAQTDGHFAQLLQSDTLKALEGFDLPQEERIAVIRRDRTALRQFGLSWEFTEQFGISD